MNASKYSLEGERKELHYETQIEMTDREDDNLLEDRPLQKE